MGWLSVIEFKKRVSEIYIEIDVINIVTQSKSCIYNMF